MKRIVVGFSIIGGLSILIYFNFLYLPYYQYELYVDKAISNVAQYDASVKINSTKPQFVDILDIKGIKVISDKMYVLSKKGYAVVFYDDGTGYIIGNRVDFQKNIISGNFKLEYKMGDEMDHQIIEEIENDSSQPHLIRFQEVFLKIPLLNRKIN